MKINNEAIEAINEGLDVPSFIENKEIRIKYVATDGWRGYYDAVPTKKGGWIKIESNWMTGNWDDAGENGGGIEIDVSELFGEGCKMSAYQNYLGGGLLGAIMSDINFIPSEEQKENVLELAEELKRYFHEITNEEASEYDEWNEMSYEKNQSMPSSGY